MSKKRKLPARPRATALKVLVGLVLLGIGAYAMNEYAQFERTAEHTTGVIKSLDRHTIRRTRRGGAVTTIRPHIEFTPAGAHDALTAQTAVDERDGYEVGAQVDVEYQPASPMTTLRIATGIPTVDAGTGVLGLALLVDAVVRAVLYRRAIATFEAEAGAAEPGRAS
jgi:hypothetical protein